MLLSYLILLFTVKIAYPQKAVRHFIFFSEDRAGIHDSVFYKNQGIRGAQITYPWKKLEPSKGKYDFKEIEADLNFLTLHGKKLFIQLQDVTFDSTLYATPGYIQTDPYYHGGANSQYDFTKDHKTIKAGWVTRRWDPRVAGRFHTLLKKLAEQFDGRIEGINLPETAVDFHLEDGLQPEGFTPQGYANAIKKNMKILKNDFKKSIPLLYANFMPGDSSEHLIEIYNYARQIKLAMGGPDLMVYRNFQMANSYPLIRNMEGIAPTGLAVQEGDYSVINPKTGKKVTIQEIMDFATRYLKLSYIFWCTEEPYYSTQVLPMLKSNTN